MTLTVKVAVLGAVTALFTGCVEMLGAASTVSVAVLEVTLPMELLIETENVALLSESVVAGVM